MIVKDKCQLIGSLVKPHGTRGSLLLRLKNIQSEELIKKETVFVEIDGLLVPFFVGEYKIQSAEAVVVKLDEIDSETSAKAFSGRRIFVSPDQIRRKKKSLHEIPDIRGYKVTDVHKGIVGTAQRIEDIAKNPLLYIIDEYGKEFLIPVHEDIILEIDDNRKEIRINAPEGLFEL